MKKLFVSLLVLMLFITNAGSAVYAEKENPASNVSLAEESAAAIVIERDTGKILFEKESHKQLPPASMTKIMTMLLIMEQIDEGSLKYEDQVRVSEKAASMGGSQVFLEPGEEMTVDDMLKAIAVASGNDASVAMAEHIGGTEEEFVKMMNEKAKQLGLKDTKFQNTNGLPVADHYTSAHDLAVMSKELLKYENITAYTGIYEDYLRKGTDKEFWLVNTNKLVRFYPGVDGLKTGFTKEAKYGLTATAEKGGMRVIAVVMGAPTSKERNSQVTSMLDYAFNQYMTKPLQEQGDVMGEVPVVKGVEETVRAVTPDKVSVLLKKGTDTADTEVKVEMAEALQAPVKKGDVVGHLLVQKNGQTLSKTQLVAETDVADASWWTLFKRMMSTFAGN
ncbi:D-alanyl-D-alanine carboxypeptidase family protein [Shouchella lonarensis]|uniref:serine-type D-Ala-D-Ala carboxypeptidase n=1 Tax=Shouchella lonarensis TaxID=1464122 RepID=A0A1G6LHY1_9BACI|nr:D-alanyl-D-alanine carboxypeptidase family protein [Shouchella lonarensis]SDC42841.1 D-Ala-D-Ala carboxypeptidase DacF. Serine peptidase. MEROPS family S11 [Shouchella lonarensis]